MTKEEIQKEIAEMDVYLPVSKIEENLGMPKTTLQKVLSGERELPKKWSKVLGAYFVKKPEKKVVVPEKEIMEAEVKSGKKEMPKGLDKGGILKWLRENN